MPRRDYLDYVTLFSDETEESLRARVDAWANEGRSPLDTANWTDTRIGTYFQITTEGSVREGARIYDRLSEVIAMSLPMYAAGTYLDDIAESRGLARLDATSAEGIIRFTGASGTPIPTNTGVSAVPVTPDDEPPSYVTVVPGTIPVGGFVDLLVRASVAGHAGNGPSNSVTVLDTPITGVTVTNPDPMTGGTDPETDDDLAERIMTQFQDSGTANVRRYKGWALSYPGVGRVTVLPHGLGAGTVLVIVSQKDGSVLPSSVIIGLQDFLDPPHYRNKLSGAQTLPLATITVDSTAGTHIASVSDPGFIRIGNNAVSYTGQTSTTFTGCTGGFGIFPDDTEVTQSGDGHGVAPIGHHVFVQAAALLLFDVNAQVELETGYSLDGLDGLIAVRQPIYEALKEYIDAVESGDEVVIEQVKAQIATTPGIHDLGTVTLNGGTTNVNVNAIPPQIAQMDELFLTAI